MSTATATSFKTVCLLCHGVQENPPLNIPLNGTPGKDAAKFIERLLLHVGKKHGVELKQGLGLLDQYRTFLVLSQFESEDPSVQAILNAMRADIFQRCRKNVPSDEDLQIVLSRCETPDDYLQAMRALRDLCCETGPHAPQRP